MPGLLLPSIALMLVMCTICIANDRVLYLSIVGGAGKTKSTVSAQAGQDCGCTIEEPSR